MESNVIDKNIVDVVLVSAALWEEQDEQTSLDQSINHSENYSKRRLPQVFLGIAREVVNSFRPWGKTCRCIKFHQNTANICYP